MKNFSKIIEPNILLQAYKEGVFPMADSRNGRISFYSADPRAIFPIYDLKMPKSLKQFLKNNKYEFTINHSFPEVINQCSNRDDTWISNLIINSYIELHELGYAHSVETWENDQLIGGLYGVSIGGAFFGESMFSLKNNASKSSFYFLVEYLKSKKFLLLDSQFINDHTKLLGAIEIPLKEYIKLLKVAINSEISFK